MTVDEYLAEAPEPQRTTLTKLRALLRSILPQAEEGLSYGVPALRIEGTPVAGYAYFKKHCGYYPHSGSVLEQIEPELLEDYEWAKGTLRLPIDWDPDEALIRRLVEMRISSTDR